MRSNFSETEAVRLMWTTFSTDYASPLLSPVLPTGCPRDFEGFKFLRKFEDVYDSFIESPPFD